MTTTMSTGLTDEQLEEVASQLASFSEVERVVLFGSRALGVHKPASDVDLAIFGEKVTASIAAAVKFEIEEETYLPFFFDVVAYSAITDERFKQKIDSQSIVIYERNC